MQSAPWVIRLLSLDCDAEQQRASAKRTLQQARIAVAKAALQSVDGEHDRVSERLRQHCQQIPQGYGATVSEDNSGREIETRRRAIAA